MRSPSLDAADAVWADHAFDLMARPRDVMVGNNYVARSPYAIAQSAQALVDIYQGTPKLTAQMA